MTAFKLVVSEVRRTGDASGGCLKCLTKKEERIMIVENYKDYGCYDYPSECEELNGFRLGEVVYDGRGDIGVILALYKDGDVRVNSNGVVYIGNISKCPDDIARKEMKKRKPIKYLGFSCGDELRGLKNRYVSIVDKLMGKRKILFLRLRILYENQVRDVVAITNEGMVVIKGIDGEEKVRLGYLNIEMISLVTQEVISKLHRPEM